MATPDDYIEKAASYIGISGTDNVFNTWYWGFNCYDPNIYPWCAAFQSYIGVHDLGMPFAASASAAGVANQGDWVNASEARKGDWVLFNWDGRQSFGWADHIGVVEWSDISGSGYFGTIEGNTGYAYGGEVARCTRTVYGGYSVAFYRPPYDGVSGSTPVQIPGSVENDMGVYYRAHVQDVGWLDPVRDGQVAGTTGYGKRLEAFKIDPPDDVVLTVKAHIEGLGWKTYEHITRGSETVIGTVGEGRRIEMLAIEPEQMRDRCHIEFRVHQALTGWKGWTPGGYATGTDGMGIGLEALQVRMVRE